MESSHANSGKAASLVIPTRNRKSELRELIHSALTQTAPLEVIIIDDASTDGTDEMMQNDFPDIVFERQSRSHGPAFLRNRGIQKASCNIVISLDDDARFASPKTAEQTLAEFDEPRVGAVGIPFVNVRQNTMVVQCSPRPDQIFAVHAFVGAAHALRRDVFKELGGYREWFYYMGEEGDYCLRLLNAGYITRLGNADPVHHLESPRRHTPLADRSGRRNDILFAWHNAPAMWLPIHLAMTTINGIRSGIAAGNVRGMLGGTLSGYAQMWALRHERHPVASSIYRLHRRLKKGGPLPLSAIEHELPARSTPSSSTNPTRVFAEI